ncbi:MAG: D-alanyl-D-alanine dipeptidase [Rickettsiales bacterium]|nr:D-alanyl-D-alanine dipeptidase [Rickettsiales bacterium]
MNVSTPALPLEKPRLPLVEIVPPAFDVEHFIAYATEHNFTGAPVYQRPACFLYPEAAEKLSFAIQYARELDLRLKLFDAYRPTEAQWALWHHTPDPDFLAHPERGSPHSRGVAIDLTLITMAGEELDMGTAFDAFTPLSYHGAAEISAEAKHNRLLLLGIMTSAGFDFYRNEWWHYQLFNSRQYPLLSDADAGTAMMA